MRPLSARLGACPLRGSAPEACSRHRRPKRTITRAGMAM
jgi:hypothetical protein